MAGKFIGWVSNEKDGGYDSVAVGTKKQCLEKARAVIASERWQDCYFGAGWIRITKYDAKQSFVALTHYNPFAEEGE